MRRIILLAGILFSMTVHAEWKIEKKDDVNIYKNDGLEFSYEKTNVAPEVAKVKEIAGYKAVFFLASVSGTSVMIKEYHAALFNPKTKELVGIFPHHYELISEGNADDVLQPIWQEKGGKLVIKETDLGIKKVLKALK